MRFLGLAFAGILFGASPAAAQYYIPRPPAPIGALPADDVADIVHAMGLDPVGPPMANGPFYVQRAIDDYGRMLRVTVDARRSQVIAVEGGQRHYGYGYGRPPHPGYAALRPHYDNLAPPGSVMAPPPGRQVAPSHPIAPPAASTPRPAVKSAAVPPQKTPVPRKRPASAPEQAAAGTVEPVAPPQSAPAPVQQSAPALAPQPAPAAKPAEPAPSATPPVTPLE